ncbi:MAG TPA: hypothetical protein VGG65_02615, partial [Thermoanaerobaculia bacterium]
MAAPPRPFRVALLLATCVAALAVQSSASPRKPATPAAVAAAPLPTWAQVDALVRNQKFEEAAGAVLRILDAARERGDDAEWTKALVRQTQLRLGLHGYETAVRFLKDTPWPPGMLAQTTLDLFYAQALVQYERMNSWEIGQREKVESAGLVDLKAWTRAQLLEEAEKAYRRAWDRRAALGELPVGALAEFVEPNDYPRDVRGTLRDAVSYLFAELLADSSLWTPEQSNGTYRLDVPGLLASDGHGADALLADPAVHPVAKLVAVLGDLEAWHAGRAERAAALEARVERLRRLHGAFVDESDRAAIRKDLASRLTDYRDIPWWAMGMAELAAFHQAEGAPDNLISARASALEALRAYPQSPGGRRANRFVADIEAPEYEATSMSSDAPGRRSIRVMHKNLASLFFRAYRIDFDESVAARFGMRPSTSDVRSMLADRPEAQWESLLPATADFKLHATYVTPPMRETGAYVIVVSVRRDFAEAD